MNKTIIILAILCLSFNMGVSQILPPYKILLEDVSQVDSIKMFDKIPLNVYLTNDNSNAVDLGIYVQTFEKPVFCATLEYQLEGDTSWHSHGTIYGKKQPAPPISTFNGYVNVGAGETVGPISFDFSAFMFHDARHENKNLYMEPFTVYIRISVSSFDKPKKHYSNPVKINLNNYTSSASDYLAFRYLLSTKKPGILTGCLMEHDVSPCAFPDMYEMSILDTLIRFYPSSTFTAWAHTVLAIKDINNLSSSSSQSRNAKGKLDRAYDSNRIESDLLILRRIKTHIGLALSANNAEVKKELSFWDMDSNHFFRNTLYLVYYTKEFEDVNIPSEILEEFKINN